MVTKYLFLSIAIITIAGCSLDTDLLKIKEFNQLDLVKLNNTDLGGRGEKHLKLFLNNLEQREMRRYMESFQPVKPYLASLPALGYKLILKNKVNKSQLFFIDFSFSETKKELEFQKIPLVVYENNLYTSEEEPPVFFKKLFE